MPQRSLPSYLLITLKGIAMGAADVIPGVSGGTIAFITGIYEELLETIANVNFDLLRVLRKEGVKAAWQKLNGNFILALLAGIAIAILSLAHLISWLLENKPIQLWSFFFGLVFASIFLVGKQVSKWSILSIIGFIIGAIVAFIITTLPPVAGGTGYLFYFFCGMIAICAMILPGISGSFILLLLGAYATIINAIKEFELGIIGVFAAGCLVGILSFSKLLNWLFKHHRNITISLLAGFLLGSLPKLWPWKKSGELLYTHSDGKEVHMLHNVLPSEFPGDQLLLPAVAFALFGLAVIFVLERFGKKA